MSETYSDLTYSEFPESVSTMERKQDVTAAMKPYVDLYNRYYSSGDFDNANKVLNDHPELLKMIVNSYTFNELRDNIIAVQRMFRDDTEDYIFTVVKNKGVWSDTAKYIKYNVVFYNNLPYMAIANNIPIGALPTDKNYWYALAIKGEQGASGLGLTPRGVWSEYTQYYQHDMVSYNNGLWAATEDNIGYFPTSSSSVWYNVLSMNIAYGSLKISNEEIDNIINGTATLKDDDIEETDYDSISKDEIDNVISG